MTAFTAADAERLRTWALEVAATLLPDVEHRDEGAERRFLGNGGLLVNRIHGAWCVRGTGQGSFSTVRLIEHLRLGYSPRDAITWATAFLNSHPGTGTCTGSADDADGEAAEPASRADAERVLRDMIPIEGTPGERYLRSRGLAPPWPPCLGYIADARVGEGAVVGILTARDRIVGVQIGYLDPNGAKSLVSPQRRRFNLEKAPDAVFIVRGEGAGTAPLLITEGLEDALSVAPLPDGPVIGLPGIGALARIDITKGAKVLVIRDGGSPASPSDKALIRGVDHLLLRGATVWVTNTPEGSDANSILQSDGIEALRALFAEATQAELSLDGDAERLSKLDPAAYDRERHFVARRHGVRVGTLDDLVKAHRPRPERPATDPSDITIDEDAPWDGPAVQLAATLDSILHELNRYVVATETELAAVAAWCAHTHLIHHASVRLTVSPRLGIQAPTEDSGKTILLEVVRALSSRGLLSSSFTAASVFRIVDAVKPSLFMDEVDQIIRERNHPLMAVLNGSHRRTEASVYRVETDQQGRRLVQKFSSWGALATAGIGVLPRTLQSRSIVITLRKALAGEQPEHLQDGTSPELVALRRQLAAWAAALTELPAPQLSADLVNRAGDNWRVLIGIADLAGGRWPELIREAAENAVRAERVPSLIERLLTAVRTVLDGATGNDTDPDNAARLTTPTIVQALLNDAEEDWDTVRQGKPVSAYFLRDQLRGLLTPPEEGKPPGAAEWWTGPAGRRQHHRGYYRLQFEEAWQRYLPNPSHPSGASGRSGSSGDNRGKAAENGGSVAPDRPGSLVPTGQTGRPRAPDAAAAAPDAGKDLGRKNRRSSAKKSMPERDAPDTPDTREGGAKKGSERPNGAATDDSTAQEPRSSLTEQIREAKAANPDRSTAWLAKQTGQSETTVRQALGETGS